MKPTGIVLLQVAICADILLKSGATQPSQSTGKTKACCQSSVDEIKHFASNQWPGLLTGAALGTVFGIGADEMVRWWWSPNSRTEAPDDEDTTPATNLTRDRQGLLTNHLTVNNLIYAILILLALVVVATLIGRHMLKHRRGGGVKSQPVKNVNDDDDRPTKKPPSEPLQSGIDSQVQSSIDSTSADTAYTPISSISSSLNSNVAGQNAKTKATTGGDTKQDLSSSVRSTRVSSFATTAPDSVASVATTTSKRTKGVKRTKSTKTSKTKASASTLGSLVVVSKKPTKSAAAPQPPGSRSQQAGPSVLEKTMTSHGKSASTPIGSNMTGGIFSGPGGTSVTNAQPPPPSGLQAVSSRRQSIKSTVKSPKSKATSPKSQQKQKQQPQPKSPKSAIKSPKSKATSPKSQQKQKQQPQPKSVKSAVKSPKSTATAATNKKNRPSKAK